MLLLLKVPQLPLETVPVRLCWPATCTGVASFMALGFGFNKAKVLAAAEKFVQQGKLQNAISEYLKVTKEDPKDLTVMNTVGDLYARLGQNAEAIQCFKQVGEAYAAEGFTVKAIAIYKKLNKVNPSAGDCVLKLAELYSQQGLFNDARAQYLSLAERALRAGDNQQASQIFCKLLELDPENAAMQAKLAELYIKLDRKDDARNIFFTAAESLYRRGAMEAADEALGRVLALDEGYLPALTLRGCIAAETGDAAKAIQHLEKIPDLDSQPDALRAMLRAQLHLGHNAEAMPIASKLLNVHNDLSGIVLCADHLMATGEHEAALRLYDQYADRLLADDRDSVLAKICSTPAHLSSNAAALELVLKLYRKAGDSAHLAEVMELLAHALVQAGELVRARDLYNQLAALEPENPLHVQNYKQVSLKLGDDAANRPLTVDEATQALMVDELEIDAPPIDQEYPAEVARAIRTALTDSELLDSYNLPGKAIAPLEAALPTAPRDALLNQRLASLYARAERFSEAARCCDVLRAVYRKAGHHRLAAQYGELAAKYHHRAGEPVPEYTESLEPSAGAPPSPQARESSEPAATTLESTRDSRHWEDMTAVEPPDDLAVVQFAKQKAAAARAGDVVGDLLEEIRFYVSQQMLEEARAAIEKCTALAPGIPELEELRDAVARSPRQAPSIPQVEVAEAEQEPTVSTLLFDSAEHELPAETVTDTAVPTLAASSEFSRPTVAEPMPVTQPSLSAEPSRKNHADLLGNKVRSIEATLGEIAGTSHSRPAQSAVPLAAAPVTSPEPRPAPLPRGVPQQPVSMPLVPAEAATIVAPRIEPVSRRSESNSELAIVFEEFKEDMESGESAADDQDPETHYNLGVAFKEMGLLEEAIGELQKVCHAIEHGHAFPHILQVYTWLAECLMNKGAPQAAVKWYQKVLQLPLVDEETRLAVYYEIAAAYEAAGNRQAALDNFMEVYANNIDYRDVAERIKTLKA